MSFSEETLLDELLHTSKLDNRHRGNLAELAFMRKASAVGFAVAKPWGEGERYDVIVRVDNVFARVQVKSVLAKAHGKSYYRVGTTANHSTRYSANDIDFLVAYIFPEDTWYIFPVALVEQRKVICLMPGSKRSRFEQYREAWSLMQPALESVTEDVAAKTAAEAAASAVAGGAPGT